MKLHSSSFSKYLIAILTVTVGLAVLTALFTLIEILSVDLYDAIFTIDMFLISMFIFVLLISVIVYLVWIYRVHKDLRDLDHEYPITPSSAIWKNIIPIYNLYGIWKVFTVMGDYYRDQAEDLKQNQERLNSFGKILTSYIPIIYVLSVISAIVSGLGVDYNMDFDVYQETSWLLFISAVVDVIVYFLFLNLVKATFSGLVDLSKMKKERVNNDEVDENYEPQH